MRIIFLIRSLSYGGAERQLVSLARGLHEQGHSVQVATFYPGGPLEGNLDDSNVQVVTLNKRGRWDVFGFLLRLISFVRVESPHILHAYLSVPNLLTILLKPLFPHIRMVWGVRASNMDLAQYDWLARIGFRAECILSRFSDLIIVNSNAGRDYHWKHGFPEKKMVVIPNGIDIERFKPDPEARSRVKAEWGIKDHEKLVGLVGRLDPMKDHSSFLKAASLLTKEREDVRFVCVGDGPEPYKSRLKNLSSELGLNGKIIWAGSRSDMTAVYSALDIVGSSSYGEGFPNVIGEAMACGVPCVVTDVGDSAWIVGDTGVVVRPQKAELLASALLKMIERIGTQTNPPLGELCRKRIVDNFSVSALIASTEIALNQKICHKKIPDEKVTSKES